ncbi:orotidine-5'-phosphate decarboxylase [Enterococcus avium]|uniref:orotidine-5'-phosphate decarboxylase n=1 Tax=Enterococcus avium TaxID=33945 RepID=UPI00232F1D78|nr:orotidine-5'-phosphate decarboxylase [Enterococcus avium]MDB1751375.1 orotidine-5'-phosphate decarboxylase [Enterococcus avium]MDB1755560.1 orotidine-5'-phosphate decarboxylase [Enterococcus avium]MDB1762620.1 orotidine-5'-phosphate decarboxylase [Enterococcus avium]
MENRPIIAFDFASKQEIETFLTHFPISEKLFVKIGMELFYQEGPAIVNFLRSQGHDIFLDLKLHDIPNTVQKAMRGIAKMGVKITNVHAAGGVEMMQAAKQGLTEGTKEGQIIPELIAVTQLTSTSEEQMHEDQLIEVSLQESVLHYAKCAEKAGLEGVVCSAHEVEKIHQATNANFICLTPGIRPQGASVGDQKRVMTPAKAREIGSNYIVVGRPITQAENPYESYLQIKKEWNGEA